ncbi:MAG: PIN domain-containing protein [Petrotogales bacterium]
MKRLKICVDTNIWIDYAWKKTGSNKAKRLLELLTNVDSKHLLIIPKILELELKYKFIRSKKKDYLVKEEDFSTEDFYSNDSNKIIFNTKLTQNYKKEIVDFFDELRTSKKNKIVSNKIDLNQVESLIDKGFEPMDSLIIVQANSANIDYFVTRDSIARQISSQKLNWIKMRSISPNKMIQKLEE